MTNTNESAIAAPARSLRRSGVRQIVRFQWLRGLAVLVVVLAAGVLVTPGLFAEGVGKVLGVEAGYGLVSSTRDLALENRNGLVTSLSWGYVIGDKANSMTVLSLVAGYDFFPLAPDVTVLHNFVYGMEYAHVFFRQSPVSLVADYGLLFNLIGDAERHGYAFGHHTRLGLGAMWNLSDRHKLTLNAYYNMVTFPYFETSRSNYSFPALALRYSLFF
jgi:hypothetical protein